MCVQINKTPLNEVHSFGYLGNTVTPNAKMDSEINTCTAQTSAAFGRLYHRLFTSHDLSIPTTLKVYKAAAIPTLLYG